MTSDSRTLKHTYAVEVESVTEALQLLVVKAGHTTIERKDDVEVESVPEVLHPPVVEARLTALKHTYAVAVEHSQGHFNILLWEQAIQS